MSSGFPSGVLRLLCLSVAFYLAELPPTTTCCCSCSLCVAFRNLRESQSWGRAVAEHFLHKIWPSFTKIAVLDDVLACIVKFGFSSLVVVKVTFCCLDKAFKFIAGNVNQAKQRLVTRVQWCLRYRVEVNYVKGKEITSGSYITLSGFFWQ